MFLLVSLLLAGATSAVAQSSPSREFSLTDRVFVSLTPDWVERRDVPPPPAALLVTSAPHLRFSDVLILENRRHPGVIELLFSDNPYLGQNSSQLQTDLQINARAIQHLFYFFFPPPSSCLARGEALLDKAVREAEAAARERESDEKRRTSSASIPTRSVSARCEFGPEPRDFFAEQISPGVTLRSSAVGRRVEGQLHRFFLPTMEETQMGEMTFLIFEAQAERLLDRVEVERYGFADQLVGARVHFFWAIAARTPFPFLDDPQRKDRQLVHVVYATLSPSGDARPLFLDLLRSLRFSP